MISNYKTETVTWTVLPELQFINYIAHPSRRESEIQNTLCGIQFLFSIFLGRLIFFKFTSQFDRLSIIKCKVITVDFQFKTMLLLKKLLDN